jgi:hypothetical protein
VPLIPKENFFVKEDKLGACQTIKQTHKKIIVIMNDFTFKDEK